MSANLAQRCGALILGGFSGHSLPADYGTALGRGRRAGAILFRRNLSDANQACELTESIRAASPKGAAPTFVALDQEGGRVRRLGAPLLQLPPMRALASGLSADELTALARAVGRELTACGFTLNFAPVLDVDSNPQNPVIGDRACSALPEQVARLGLAFASGLLQAGVIPCGKHFPGHGDTASDSHLELPRLPHDLARLRRLELAPFAAAARADLPSLMTAHIVFEALDSQRPATLSRAVLTDLLRGELGYQGVVFTDCLEMQAISDHVEVAEAAVQSVSAGADVVLICHSFERQEAALEALIHEAERSPAFAARVQDAARRSTQLRAAYAPHPQNLERRTQLFASHSAWQRRLDAIAAQYAAELQGLISDPTER